MSVRAGRRPPNGSLRRRPRGDRAADQMALNGLLVRSDNSDRIYKTILADVLAANGYARPASYAAALRALSTSSLGARREILGEAALRYASGRLYTALIVCSQGPGAAGKVLGSALNAAGHRLRILEAMSAGAVRKEVKER